VLATVDPGTDRRQTTTRIILQNIRTLAADQQHQQDTDGKPKVVTVVTLLLTPKESETLTLAATEGRIQLALRNTLDMGEINTPGERIASLVAAPARSSSARASTPRSVRAAPGPVIESYEGGRRTLLRFERGGGR
jgi:pilus assembly protein CpaB